MWTVLLWSIAGLAAGIYCLAKAAIDLRPGRYGWGIIGLLSALVFVGSPIQPNAVEVDRHG